MPDRLELDFWDSLVLYPDTPAIPGSADERVILAIERLLPDTSDSGARERARRKVLGPGRSSVSPNGNAPAIGTPQTSRAPSFRDLPAKGRSWRWALLAAAFFLLIGGIATFSEVRSPLRNANEQQGAIIPAAWGELSNVPMRGVNPGRTSALPGSAPEVVPEVQWRFDVKGRINASPLIVDGIVYAGESSLSPQDPGTIFALRASDGALLWTYPTSAGLTATFALQDETLYAIDDRGDVYALNAANGVERWHVALRDGQPYQFTWFGALLTIDGRLIVSSGSSSAVAAGNGTIFAGVQSPDWIEGDPHIYAISLEDGQVLWDVPNFPEGSQGGVVALSADDGTVIWNHKTSPAILGPAFADGVVYYGEQQPTALVAVDANNGDEIWRSEFSNDIELSGIASPAITDDAVLVVTMTGDLASLDRRTGKLSWIVDVFNLKYGFTFNLPEVAVAGRTAIAVGYEAISAVDLTNHSILWHLGIGVSSRSPAVVFDNKIVLVAGGTISNESNALVMLGEPSESP